MTDKTTDTQAQEKEAQAQGRAEQDGKKNTQPVSAPQPIKKEGQPGPGPRDTSDEDDGANYDNPIQEWFQTSLKQGLNEWRASGDKVINGVGGLQDTPEQLLMSGERYVFKLFNWDFWDESKKFMDFETANKDIKKDWEDIKNKTTGNAQEGVSDGFKGLAQTLGLTSLLNACGINITTPEQEATANANEQQAVINNINSAKQTNDR